MNEGERTAERNREIAELEQRIRVLEQAEAERTRTMDALRISAAVLESVVENSPSAIWISDENGTMIRMNQACRDLLHGSDSEVDRGTTFKIYLPRVQEEAVPLIMEAPDSEMMKGKETVLLVEDDENVRDVALNMLEHLGYRVLTAANGGEAFLLMEKHADDVAMLMTDVVMPGMNGRELAERLLELKPALNVLFTSGYTENVIVHHGILESSLNSSGSPIPCRPWQER